MGTAVDQRGSRDHGDLDGGGGDLAALLTVAAVQLMVVLDGTVVYVALPRIQADLGFSAAGLSWVVNAYALAFGGLLLLGGRLGDLLGHRRLLLAGVAVFAVASLAGGLASEPWLLLAARAVQGAGAALAAPAALGLIPANFPAGPSRTRAISVYTAVAGTGAVAGLVIGGVLTDVASWRWVLFINVPIGAAVIALGPRAVRDTVRIPARLDVAGALLATTGTTLLVHGLVRAAQQGWDDTLAVGSLAASAALLAGFVAAERRTDTPLLPLRLVADRALGARFAVMLLLPAAMFGMFFYLTQYLQVVHRYEPLRAGLAFVPLSGSIVVTAGLVPRLLARFRPAPIAIAGLATVIPGLLWLTRVDVDTGYAGGVLGPSLLLGSGAGLVLSSLTVAILSAVPDEESGVAGGVVNVLQQVGGSLGLAVLITAWSTAGGSLTAGMPRAFLAAAVLAGAALAVTVATRRA